MNELLHQQTSFRITLPCKSKRILPYGNLLRPSNNNHFRQGVYSTNYNFQKGLN